MYCAYKITASFRCGCPHLKLAANGPQIRRKSDVASFDLEPRRFLELESSNRRIGIGTHHVCRGRTARERSERRRPQRVFGVIRPHQN